MKRMIIVLLSVVLFVATGCSGSSPKIVTQKYFSAVKSGDIEKAKECFTPEIQNMIKASEAISDALFGVDSEALYDGLLSSINAETYDNYDFKVTEVEETDDTHAVVTVAYSNGSDEGTTSIYCVKIDDDWYIEY